MDIGEVILSRSRKIAQENTFYAFFTPVSQKICVVLEQSCEILKEFLTNIHITHAPVSLSTIQQRDNV
jgi:hypothetical protein